MRKLFRVVTGIFFVGTVFYAYSTAVYVVTYYHQIVSDPALREPTFRALALGVFIAAVVFACKLKNRTLWGVTGCAVLVSLGLAFGFRTQIQQYNDQEHRSQKLHESLTSQGVDEKTLNEVLSEDRKMISDLMDQHRSEGESEYQKGLQYYKDSKATQAVYWLTKSAKHLYKPAYYKLIDMYSKGDLVEKNLITAGAFAHMLTMLISTPKEAEFVSEIHRKALATRVEGGPNPYSEIKRMRDAIWTDNEWSGK